MNRREVRIVGMGIVSAIGVGIQETLQSLSSQKTGVGDKKLYDRGIYGVPVGEVKLTNEEIEKKLDVKHGEMSRTALLSLAAVHEAIEMCRLTGDRLARTVFISATTTGGMRETEKFYKDYIKDHNKGRLCDVRHHACHDHTDAVAEKLGIKGWRTTISTACSSGANAIMMGAMMIESGMTETVIAGGADALCGFTMGGFNSLKILSKGQCHPLSEERDGLNLGEGAAYLVMTADKGLDDKGWRLEGWANACDAYHQTAMSESGIGAKISIGKTIRGGNIANNSSLGYINLHGTATPNNDLSEMNAVNFGWKHTPYGSTKGLTGHTLAAAGAIEAVISILASNSLTAWGTAGLQTPMKIAKCASTENIGMNSKYVLSNSLGFGGNCTSLLFRAL